MIIEAILYPEILEPQLTLCFQFKLRHSRVRATTIFPHYGERPLDELVPVSQVLLKNALDFLRLSLRPSIVPLTIQYGPFVDQLLQRVALERRIEANRNWAQLRLGGFS